MQGRLALRGEQAQFKYAYHFDAAQYGAFLRKHAMQRGAASASCTSTTRVRGPTT